MNASRIIWRGAWMALAAQLALAQASLPTSWTGPWEYSTPPAGWTFSGLGVDYVPGYDGYDDGAAKLDTTGDYIEIAYDGPASSVSYWIKGLSLLSGAVFRVEASTNGINWTTVHTYINPPTNATFQRYFPPLNARHVRFIYTERFTGNVGLDGITIGSYVPPAMSAWSRSGGVARATVPETSEGRTYALEATDTLVAEPWVEWAEIDSVTGDGGALDLVDSAATNDVRYYRVRDATP